MSVEKTHSQDVPKATKEQVEVYQTLSAHERGDKDICSGDYSGASAKTDPDEIRLVKKLDLRIMVCFWIFTLGNIG